MKKVLIPTCIITLLLIILLPTIISKSASGPAISTRFTTSLTYQNIDSQTATDLFLQSYDSSKPYGEVVIKDLPDLPKHAGGSISMQFLDDGSKGSAILVTDKNIVVTMIQVPHSSNPDVKSRMMSNASTVGASKIYVPSVVSNQYDTTTIFSIQNVDTYPNTITINFYNSSGSIVSGYTKTKVIQPGNVYYYNAGTEIGTSFSGSAIVTSIRQGSATEGKIIADIREYAITGFSATAYEGIRQGSTTLFVPFAMCNTFGGQSTAYAIQNTSQTYDTTATVRYYDQNGSQICSYNVNIPHGAKASVQSCNCGGTSGMNGSVKITSNTTDIVAVGKVFGMGMSNSAVAFTTLDGMAKYALPYVRWSEDNYYNGSRQRTYISIQNIGSSDISAGKITVKYYDKYGNLVVTHTINSALKVYQKTNSNAYITGDPDGREFGYYPDMTYGGSAVVECTQANCKIVAIARSSTYKSSSDIPSEDYNGFPIP